MAASLVAAVDEPQLAPGAAAAVLLVLAPAAARHGDVQRGPGRLSEEKLGQVTAVSKRNLRGIGGLKR